MWPPRWTAIDRRPLGGRRSIEVAGLLGIGAVLLACFGWRVGAFDLESSLRAAHWLLHGRSPYSPVTSATFRSGHAFVYPYVVAWAFVPLAVLPVPAAVTLFVGLSALAILVACRLLGRTGFLPPALLLSSSTTIVGLQMGTLNALLLLGVAVAWSQRDRWVTAGLAVAATALAKLFLLPLLVWLVLARRLRAAAVAATALVAALGVGWIVGPLDEHAYAAMLGILQGNESPSSWSVASFADSVGASRGVAEAVGVALGALVVLAGAIRSRRTGDERVLFAASVLASLLSTPIVWSSYLLVLAAVVLVVATDDRKVAALAVASWVIVTPDVASTPRIATGMAITGGLALLAFWRAHNVGVGRTADRDRVLAALSGWQGRLRRHLPELSGLLGLVATLVLVPPTVRSAMPALLLMAAAAVELIRIGPAHRPSPDGSRAVPQQQHLP